MIQATETKDLDGKQRRENPIVSLVVNIVIPALILKKLSGPDHLGPLLGLALALACPLMYGLWDFLSAKRWNIISMLGLVSILLTGGIGMFKLPTHWIAIKEAAIPGIIGIAIIASLRTRFSLINKLLYNEAIFNLQLIEEALQKKGGQESFQKLLARSSYIVAASFFLSSILNFILAKVIVHSDPGSVSFNEELGTMTALSYPVIVVPSMLVLMLALWQLLSGIKKLTGLDIEKIFHTKGGSKP